MTTLTRATPAAPTDTRSCEAAGDALLRTLREANPGATVTGKGQTMVARDGTIVGCQANASVSLAGATTIFDAKVDLSDKSKPVATLGVTNQEGTGNDRRTTSAFTAQVPVTVTPGATPTAPATVALGTEVSREFVRDHANDRGGARPLNDQQMETLGTWHGQVSQFAQDAGLGLKAPAPTVPPVSIGRRPTP